MDKVIVKGYISKDLDDRFRRLIAQKHGKYQRLQLSKELELAISKHVATGYTQQQNTQNFQNSEKRSFKVLQNWRKIRDYLIQNGHIEELEKGRKFPDKLLKIAIEDVNGTDHRTYDSWEEKFIKHNIICKIANHQYEVMYSEDYEFESSNVMKEKQFEELK